MEQSIYSLVYIAVKISFFILLFAYTIHGIFLAYHWFTYGSSREMSITGLVVYLFGGAVLFLTFSISIKLLPI